MAADAALVAATKIATAMAGETVHLLSGKNMSLISVLCI
ncbi:protein of unknown function [Candidatus Filomicrobium marinum]|uniref:Uncharacterized protein n=1 Tax=Candidatus Filomicrobium marinum TaxID=1608628 RepID=A0A0D6JCD7_9HYPH|nr:protein of unknown function [Candidatus Filomicrobium marinum]